MAHERFVTKAAEAPNARVSDFLDVIVSVCRAYGLSIAHEDHHGAFIIEEYSKVNIDWLKDAHFSEDLPEAIPSDSWTDAVYAAVL